MPKPRDWIGWGGTTCFIGCTRTVPGVVKYAFSSLMILDDNR